MLKKCYNKKYFVIWLEDMSQKLLRLQRQFIWYKLWYRNYLAKQYRNKKLDAKLFRDLNTRPARQQTGDEEPNYCCRSPVNCRGGNRFPLSTAAKGHSSFMFSCSIYWTRYTNVTFPIVTLISPLFSVQFPTKSYWVCFAMYDNLAPQAKISSLAC